MYPQSNGYCYFDRREDSPNIYIPTICVDAENYRDSRSCINHIFRKNRNEIIDEKNLLLNFMQHHHSTKLETKTN